MKNEMSDGAREALAEAQRAEYYYQMSVIDSLVNKSRALLAFLVAVTTLAVAVLHELDRPLGPSEAVALVLFSVSLIPITRAAWKLWGAFRGPSYRDLPAFSEYEKRFHRKGDELEWLHDDYGRAADANRSANKQRMEQIDSGAKWLAIGVIGVVLMAIASQADLLEGRLMPDDRTETQNTETPGESEGKMPEPQDQSSGESPEGRPELGTFRRSGSNNGPGETSEPG